MNGSQHGVCLILHKPVTQSARQAPGIWPGRRGFDSTLLVWLRHVRSLWPGKEVPAVLQLLNCCSRIGFAFGSASVGLFGLLAACLIYQRTKLLHML